MPKTYATGAVDIHFTSQDIVHCVKSNHAKEKARHVKKFPNGTFLANPHSGVGGGLVAFLKSPPL